MPIFVVEPLFWESLLLGLSYHRLDHASATMCMQWTYRDVAVTYDADTITPLNTDRALMAAMNAESQGRVATDVLRWAEFVLEGTGRVVVLRVPETEGIVMRVYATSVETAEIVQEVATRTGLCRVDEDKARQPAMLLARSASKPGAALATC